MESGTIQKLKIAAIIIVCIIIGMNIIAIFTGLLAIVFIGFVIWMIIKRISKVTNE